MPVNNHILNRKNISEVLIVKKYISVSFSLLFANIVLPYLMILFINGQEYCLEVKDADIQGCLMWSLMEQIPEGYGEEAAKVQAVIARTNLYRDFSEGKSLSARAKEILEQGNQRDIYFLDIKTSRNLDKILKKTDNNVLLWADRICRVPYHYCSSGRTRDGQEVFHSSEYAYLQSVDSSQDRENTGYLSEVYLDKEQFPVNMEVLQRDSSGCVTEISVDGEIYSGEEFQNDIDLVSPNFSIQNMESDIRILCKGQGHGLGYSQYGGERLAEEGKTYKQILKYYFPAMTVRSYVWEFSSFPLSETPTSIGEQ